MKALQKKEQEWRRILYVKNGGAQKNLSPPPMCAVLVLNETPFSLYQEKRF